VISDVVGSVAKLIEAVRSLLPQRKYPKIGRSLDELDKYETAILMHYLETGLNTIHQGKFNPQVLGLVHDGFLIKCGEGGTHAPYLINPAAKKMLQKRVGKG